MKKRIVTVFLACMICMAGIWSGNVEVQAATEPQGTPIDYSYLVADGALMGFAELQTRGVYLASGTSSIRRISSNTIGAGGTTTAVVKCTVAISSIVERYVDGRWLRVTSWTQTNENSYSAAISRSLVVATNNIYRVRSSHYAESDYSSSFTDNLHM